MVLVVSYGPLVGCWLQLLAVCLDGCSYCVVAVVHNGNVRTNSAKNDNLKNGWAHNLAHCCSATLYPSKVMPPPRMSYTKVPNYYSPYAYCSLDKAIDAQVQKEKIAW